MLGTQARTGRLLVPTHAAGQGAALLHGGRLLRFGVVGLLGVGLNTLVLTLLVEVAKLHYLPAAALATEAAIIGNFALNDRWTFRSSHTTVSWVHRFKRYNLIALGGLVISLLVLLALSNLLGMYYVFANLGGIAAATLWNYSVNAHLTYALPMPSMEEPVVSLVDSSAMGG